MMKIRVPSFPRTLKLSGTTIKPHRPRRPLSWVCTCCILGIIINEYIKIPLAAAAAVTAAVLILSALIRRSGVSTFFLMLAIVGLGAVYSQSYQAVPKNHISRTAYAIRKDPVLLEGVVVSDVEPRPFLRGKKTVLTLEVRRIKTKWGWKMKSGLVLVNLFRLEELRYGDAVRLEGRLHRPFNFSPENRFSYRKYLARQGITFVLSVKRTAKVEVLGHGQGRWLKGASLRLKRRFGDILEKNLAKGEAGLMRAFLLGDRYDIPKSVYAFFKTSGVAHIVAISGFNIGIVAYSLFLFLKMFPFPRKFQYVLAMVLLAFYAFMAGGQPPVVRATIMAVVFFLGLILERESEPVNTLSVSALILLFMNPLNLFDAGFQLSFLSVLAIILLYPGLMKIFTSWVPGIKEKTKSGGEEAGEGQVRRLKHAAGKYLLQSAAVSVAAYLGVVALVVYYFQLVTPVVIFANLVVVPLASLIMFLGMGLLLAGSVFPMAAFAFANCVSVALNLLVAVVYLFSQIPGAYFSMKDLPWWAVLLYYGFMVAGWGLIMLVKRKTGLRITDSD